MKKMKKILKTILWTITAFYIGIVFAMHFRNILGLVVLCSLVLITILLCINGKLPGTNIEKVIEFTKKKTPWYRWQFYFTDIFILAIVVSSIHRSTKTMDINIPNVLCLLFFIAISFLLLIHIWERRLKPERRNIYK
jgi:hypothetical protein